MKTVYWDDAVESGQTAFPPRKGERLTGMQNIAGKLYVFTETRTFLIMPKSQSRWSRFKVWLSKIWSR